MFDHLYNLIVAENQGNKKVPAYPYIKISRDCISDLREMLAYRWAPVRFFHGARVAPYIQ
jgi:hypothetical protein